MKEFRLINMTDFVLEKAPLMTPTNFRLAMVMYARFLKQPLKLEMFVPCDEEGNVLEEPNGIDTAIETEYFHDYNKAKEKVLFEGFEIDKDGDIVHKGKKLIVNTETCRINQTVESYVGKNLTLTPTALKQIKS